MGMATTQSGWTVAMLRALPDDGKRYEIIDGELFVIPSPSPDHQEAAMVLSLRLRAYLDAHRVGHVYMAPADVELADDRLVQPDLFVVPLMEGKRPRTWQEAHRLFLAVEVLSPGTARVDRVRKRELYQRHGVPEYWIVDVDARLVERWRPQDERPEIVSERLEWHPVPAHPPLEIDLPAYFAEVIGE